MKRALRAFSRLFLLCLLVGLSLPEAGAGSLDGTLWVYRHESGLMHYVAFYDNYHYLNSSGSDSYADSLWLRSIAPYFSHVNHDGSITYGSAHTSPAAWAINWGRCDINADYASFNAAGMLYAVFIFNRNEPYTLLSANWRPPSPLVAGSGYSPSTALVTAVLSTIFGE